MNETARLVDKRVRLELPHGHLHSLLCQLPNHLDLGRLTRQQIDPDQKWDEIRSVLELVTEGPPRHKHVHFLVFPEAALPVEHFDDFLEEFSERFPPNTVSMIGVDHTWLKTYREFLERWPDDNAEALESVRRDMECGVAQQIPVNWAATVIKESTGDVRVFLQAKSHPFVGEETLDYSSDLYRGKVFPLFRTEPNGFNFMLLICIDYLYRTIYHSNIGTVIRRANELFFETRQCLDLLTVIQCNPKPEHKAFRDVLSGFYGEYLEAFPGVRDAITVMCNTSCETTGVPCADDACFGASSVIVSHRHKLQRATYREFATDDFRGAPVCRVRFGSGTRLYLFNLPLFHELDPRTTRKPIKIHEIYEPDGTGSWARVTDH